MTPEEFEEFLNTTTPEELVKTFSNYTEKERKKLSATVSRKYRESEKYDSKAENDTPEKKLTYLAFMSCYQLCQLAVLAVCPWTDVKRMEFQKLDYQWDRNLSLKWFRTQDSSPEKKSLSEYAIQIIIERKPDWLERLFENKIDEMRWEMSKSLLRANLCPRPTSLLYMMELCHEAERIDFDKDPEYLDIDAWLLFKVETYAFHEMPDLKKMNLSNWKKSPIKLDEEDYLEAYQGWPRILYYYSFHGRIDRNRLLDETLDALWNDFKTNTLTGLIRFYKILEPTLDEIKQRESKYIELLRNSNAPTVTMALTTLSQLIKSSEVDHVAIYDSISSVFEIEKKTQPQKALKFLDKMTAKNSDLIPDTVESILLALKHPVADIQELAVQLVGKWKTVKNDLDLSPVEEILEEMSIETRKEIDKLFPLNNPILENEPSDSCDNNYDSFLSEIDQLSKEFQSVYGLDQVNECFDDCTIPDPLNLNPQTTPVLSTLDKIIPIASIDELLEEISIYLGNIYSSENLERIVEGILQYGYDSCENFEIRINQLANSPPPESRDYVRIKNLTDILKLWIGIRSKKIKQTPFKKYFNKNLNETIYYDVNSEIVTPLSADKLTNDLELRLTKKQMGPILSVPTHQGGWIDPREFIQRYLTLTELKIPVSPYDLILALLRLAPEFKNEALKNAQNIRDKFAPTIRYALGSSDTPKKTNDKFIKAAWVAAGRSQNPYGTLYELEELKLDNDVPDLMTHVQYEININSESQSNWEYGWAKNVIDEEFVKLCEPTKELSDLSLFPTVVLNRLTPYGKYKKHLIKQKAAGNYLWYTFSGTSYERIPTVWPAQSEACLAYIINKYFHFINYSSESSGDIDAFLKPLINPDKNWTKLGCITIWTGLLGLDKNIKNICKDIFVEGIHDGRANQVLLRETLLSLFENPTFKVNRLAEPFRYIAEISSLAKWFISDIQDALISSWSSLPRSAHLILELQYELLLALDHSVSLDARKKLESVKGSGKGAKLAKKLCALESKFHTPVQKEAIQQAFEGRLSRAKRIQNYLNQTT